MSLSKNDKSRIDYEKKKELKHMLLDKVVIGGIILILAAGGTLYLEYYRNKSQQKRYFLESFNSAIAEVMEAAASIQMEYTKITGTLILNGQEVKPASEINNVLQNFYRINTANLVRLDGLRGKYSYLFSEDLNSEIQSFINLHFALVDRRVKNINKYRSFIMAYESQLKYQVQHELGTPKKIKNPGLKVDSAIDMNEDVLAYLERRYEQWKNR